MRPLRVLFVSIVPSPYQRDFFAALHARPEVDLQVVYCEAASPDSPWPTVAPAPYERIMRGFYFSWRGKRFIVNPRLPSTDGVDVLVLNGYTPLACQRLLRRRRGPPVIFWGERMVSPSGGVARRAQGFLAAPLRRLSTIVAIGQQAADDYAERFPGIPVERVPYMCALGAFGEEIPVRPRTPPTILFCGQMIHRKGIDLLLEAFARLIGEGLAARLLLVGREAELPGLLGKLAPAVRRSVEYAGFQAPEALPHFFREADVFVLPSRYDGWGVVVNQAIGAGLPVVCSDAVGAGPDLVTNGLNGSVYPAEDTAALTDALRSLLADPQAIARASAASLARAAEVTPERGAGRWVEILQRVGGVR